MRLLAILLFLTGSLLGYRADVIDTTIPIKCTFSLIHHNRILLESGRVKKIIYPEEKLFVHMEPISGQAFIQLLDPAFKQVVVSVISDDGRVQDLDITFESEAPGEVVLLKEPLETVFMEAPCIACDDTQGINQCVGAILGGKAPIGYQCVPFVQKCIKPRFGIRANLIGKFEGEGESLLILEIRNASMLNRRLLERHFACKNTAWVFLEKNLIKSKETILGIIAVKNESKP